MTGASPNEKLNIACIGLGNQGSANLELLKSQNIVALCDVDDDHTAMMGAKFPRAKRFADFRVMFDNTDQVERFLHADYRKGWTL